MDEYIANLQAEFDLLLGIVAAQGPTFRGQYDRLHRAALGSFGGTGGVHTLPIGDGRELVRLACMVELDRTRPENSVSQVRSWVEAARVNLLGRTPHLFRDGIQEDDQGPITHVTLLAKGILDPAI